MQNNNHYRLMTALTALLCLPFASPIASEMDDIRLQLEDLQQQVKRANEWRNPNTLVHMAGYADVGYSQSEADNDDGSFSVGNFSPIFHFQYRDLVMLESELELEIEEDGETELAMEYLTIDWFVNDNMVLMAGKFLSPIGQFRQNLHPSWINKLPSAPPGFGHDGAAPVSDLGVQVRGGFHIGEFKATYSVYVSNGPEIKAEIEPDTADSSVIEAIQLDGVEAEGFGIDGDGEKVIGGRFSILPSSLAEIGISFIRGKATVTEFEADEFTGTLPSLETEPARDYEVIGADFSWRNERTEIRGEYVSTDVGDATTSVAANGEEWSTYYVQYAQQLFDGRYEAVIRYGDFDSPHDSADQQQTVIGFNRLFSNNFIGKLAFESNDNPNSGFDADNRWLIQLAYGF